MKSIMTMVACYHKDLRSTDPRIWKPLYKRLCLLARLKGYPAVRCLPGLGWTYYNGKNFDVSRASVHFVFENWWDHNGFIRRSKRIEGLTLEVKVVGSRNDRL